MATRRRWTEEEDRVLLSKIRENPGNLKQAFIETAEELGRNPQGVTTRWYKVLAPKNLNNRANTVFMTYSAQKINCNRKLSYTGTQQPAPVRKSKWRRILDILFE